MRGIRNLPIADASRTLLVAVSAGGIAAGFAANLLGKPDWQPLLWTAATIPVLLALLSEIVSSLRKRDLGLDIVAAISMTAALIFGEILAAAVVALMYAGGKYLEGFAETRARREMTALLARMPRTALRYQDGTLEEIILDAIKPQDVLLVRRGDVVPVDGTVSRGVAILDTSTITGESLPVSRREGEILVSGSTNVGDPFDLMASRRAAESTYAAIIRLVEQARTSKSPMTRLADRYAIAFLVLTLCIAAAAWLISGDPIRAVAVLVVATPCPLILAVPVALISGLSRAAKHGVLIKGAGVLEGMARVRSAIIDKTGTLTSGQPTLIQTKVRSDIPAEELLRIAASLDQASQHTVARTLVAEARGKGLVLSMPLNVSEVAGEGISGEVDGRRVVVGGQNFVSQALSSPTAFSRVQSAPGAVSIFVGLDGELAGELALADELRSETEQFLVGLRRMGIDHIIMATGDRRDVALATADSLSIDSIHAELTPDQKVLLVVSERKRGPVMMIGDGVNDAPALAAADIGIAMGARGAAASAEVADVILLVDHLDRVLPGLEIATKSRRIALESVYAGIGLSLLGMTSAAFGLITPVQGALLQEIIDVAVVFNALRALRITPSSPTQSEKLHDAALPGIRQNHDVRERLDVHAAT